MRKSNFFSPLKLYLKFLKVFIQYYNDYYTWPLAEFKSFCAIQPNDCPIVMHKNYTLETSLLLSSNKDQLHNSGRQNVSKISNE
jgi:hypothetical protein